MLFIFVKVVDTNIKPLAYKRRNSVTPNQVMNTFMEQMKNYLKEMCVIVKFIQNKHRNASNDQNDQNKKTKSSNKPHIQKPRALDAAGNHLLNVEPVGRVD